MTTEMIEGKSPNLPDMRVLRKSVVEVVSWSKNFRK